jgi:hypothetical protein
MVKPQLGFTTIQASIPVRSSSTISWDIAYALDSASR